MLEKLNKSFDYKKLTEAEQEQRGILGRLVGPCADFVNPTRNGRKYSEQLWENVFENPIMQEKIKNRCCFGELGHPEDRTEIDMEKIAICLAEQPKKGKDGKLYGVFDILNTPNGKILKSLCDYGCTVGISSRGQGDLITDMNGDEAVDPDTYDCECFDVVLLPGVEAARLKYVTESLDKKQDGKALKLALQESLNKANEKDKKIMKETLDDLNIKLDEAFNEEVEEKLEKDEEVAEEQPTEEVEQIQEAAEENSEEEIKEVETDSSEEGNEVEEESEDESDFVKEESEKDDQEESEEEYEEIEDERTDEEIFLEFLAGNFEEDQIREVCKILDIEIVEDENEEKSDEESEDEESSETADEADEDIDAKEEADETEEDEDKAIDEGLESLVNSLKEALKGKADLENNVKSLQEKLAVSDAMVNEIKEECEKYKQAVTRLSMLAKSNKDLKESVSKLEESIAEKDATIENQKTRIARLVESRKESVRNSTSLNESVTAKNNEITSLNENLNNVKADFEAQIKTLNEEFEKKENARAAEITTLTESLSKTTKLKESYKNLANKAVNKYIEVKADILGLTPRDIKRKLGESYTMEDVDQVCEDLKSYQLNVSRLPFSVDRKVGVKVHEGTKTGLQRQASQRHADDDVDDTLIKLANSEF